MVVGRLSGRPFRRGPCAQRRFSEIRCVLNEPRVVSPKTLRRTPALFKELSRRDDVGGAGGQTTYSALQRADALWERLKNSQFDPHEASFVEHNDVPLRFIDYDVIVCGGTLGIFLACTLQQRGYRVAIVERGALQGRQQEWNISRHELTQLSRAGVLSEEEVESCICSQWERVRAGFDGGHEVWTTGVLNIGISPNQLIHKVRSKFEAAGGVIFEKTAIASVQLHLNGVCVLFGKEGQLTGKLLVDCMGHFSPIVRQSRFGQKPDGVCLVVGTCARGFPKNDYSDLIKTNTPVTKNASTGSPVQYFWEAFPAGSGPLDRTTYMFAYVDPSPERPSLEDMFEDYWQLMPEYQGVQLEDLELQRALFGFFPAYKDSPLVPQFDRIVHVGDAGGLQSPLSFGGFGAMLRHLMRHTEALSMALNAKIVDKASLQLVNPYSPGLSASWLFQTVMSAQPSTPPELINQILSNNFRVMEQLGPKVMTPFLQDVTRFWPLFCTLMLQAATDPGFLITATRLFGATALMEWLPHFVKLGGYELLSFAVAPLKQVASMLPPRDMYKLQRLADAIEYGSGTDYDFP